jgi:hypothetical protein
MHTWLQDIYETKENHTFFFKIRLRNQEKLLASSSIIFTITCDALYKYDTQYY